jgi:hypothetical protein
MSWLRWENSPARVRSDPGDSVNSVGILGFSLLLALMRLNARVLFAAKTPSERVIDPPISVANAGS